MKWLYCLQDYETQRVGEVSLMLGNEELKSMRERVGSEQVLVIEELRGYLRLQERMRMMSRGCKGVNNGNKMSRWPFKVQSE